MVALSLSHTMVTIYQDAITMTITMKMTMTNDNDNNKYFIQPL